MIKDRVLLLFCNDLMLENRVALLSHLLHSRPIDPATRRAWGGADAVHPRMSVEEVEGLVAECLLVERMLHHQDIWMAVAGLRPMAWLTQH